MGTWPRRLATHAGGRAGRPRPYTLPFHLHVIRAHT
jgi:hypothetical protein